MFRWTVVGSLRVLRSTRGQQDKQAVRRVRVLPSHRSLRSLLVASRLEGQRPPTTTTVESQARMPAVELPPTRRQLDKGGLNRLEHESTPERDSPESRSTVPTSTRTGSGRSGPPHAKLRASLMRKFRRPEVGRAVEIVGESRSGAKRASRFGRPGRGWSTSKDRSSRSGQQQGRSCFSRFRVNVKITDSFFFFPEKAKVKLTGLRHCKPGL